jgi:hypothetical protein
MGTTYLQPFNRDGVLRGYPTQDVYQQSATPQYPIGTIYETNGLRFRYCKAYEAISILGRGCPSMVQYPWIATSITSAKFVSCNAFKAGDKKVTITVDDYIEDTTPYNSKDKNFFVGGCVVFFFDTNAIQTINITGSEPSTVNADSAANCDIILYLETPISKDYAAGCTADIYGSRYISIGASTSNTGWSSVACIPQCAVTSGYYFWGQTKGRCWVTPTSGITGTTIRQVYFHSDGTIKDAGTDTSLQLAGYIIYKGDNSQDDAVIQLSLE